MTAFKFLRSGRVRKITNRLQAYHSNDPIAAFLAALRVNEASHFFGLKIRRLFVHERNEAQRFSCRFAGEAAR